MTENSGLTEKKGRILYGTTVGISAKVLLRGQLAWFRRQGWDITLVSTPDEDAYQSARREGVAFFGITMKREIALLDDLRSAISWIRALRKIKPAVVNIGTPKASLLGLWAARICRVPKRIYTVRGLRLEGTHGLMAKLLWVMERLTLAAATDTIVVSHSLGRAMVHRKLISPRDVWVIGAGSSNGVDASGIQKRVSEVDRFSLRESLGIDASKFVIGFIGRLSPEKGIDTLIGTLEKEELNENVHLLVVGSSDDEGCSEAINRCDDRITSVPWTDDVWGYLPAMDVLCLPTVREGFPNVVIEAAAAGIPAITTRATGAMDSVLDGRTGFLIDIGDQEALIDRINLLVSNPELMRRLSMEAKNRAESLFNPVNIWEGIEEIVQDNANGLLVKRLDQCIEV